MTTREICRTLGEMLEYPVSSATLGMMPTLEGKSGEYLKVFLLTMESKTLTQRQEQYIQTFDLQPRCSLYISVPLFGEESYKRAELMVGLKSRFDEAGVDLGHELPDHLAVILKNNMIFYEQEWQELVTHCILPSLQKMITVLEKADNPYADALRAVREVLRQKETVHG